MEDLVCLQLSRAKLRNKNESGAITGINTF